MGSTKWTTIFKLSSGALLTLVSASQVAKAATFEGTASAIFDTPTPDTGVVFFGVGTDTFGSGDPFIPSDSGNILVVDGLDFSTTASTPFPVADLSYTNGVTFADTDVDTIPVDLTLDFDAPSGVSEIFTFTFDLGITPNFTGDPVLDADTLSVIDVFSTTTFDVGGELLTLQLLGFSSEGGAVIDNVFVLPENSTITSQLFASITAPLPSQDVPENRPAALTFFGLGVMFANKLLRNFRQ